MDEIVRKIRVGIAGFGRMGITHYSILNTREDVEIVAIADSSKLVLKWIKKYLPQIKAFNKYQDLLDTKKLDAIIVSTPPSFHYPVIKLAGIKKVHVFSEKPFTTSFSDGASLVKDFSCLNLVNQVGYVNRYNDVFYRTKEILRLGILGEVTGFKSEMFSNTISGSVSQNGWRNSTQSGGGVIYEMASHAIDLIVYLIGKPDNVENASLRKIFSVNTYDELFSRLSYKSGAEGTVHVNWCDPTFRKPLNRIEISGSYGRITVDQYHLDIYLERASDILDLKKGLTTFYITDLFRPVKFYVRGNEFSRQLGEFIDAIQGFQKSTLCAFSDALCTLEIIDGIFKHASNKETIRHG